MHYCQLYSPHCSIYCQNTLFLLNSNMIAAEFRPILRAQSSSLVFTFFELLAESVVNLLSDQGNFNLLFVSCVSFIFPLLLYNLLVIKQKCVKRSKPVVILVVDPVFFFFLCFVIKTVSSTLSFWPQICQFSFQCISQI